MTHKDIIIQAISDMNIQALQDALDDHVTYDEASKETYIRKLGELFDELKEYGNNHLIPLRAICAHEECANCGNKGHNFIGNISGHQIGLIIEETDGRVSDIFDCMDMMTEKGEIIEGQRCFITIAKDEKVAFVPDAEYLITIQKCESSLAELQENYFNRPHAEDCFYWLNKHKNLWDLTRDYMFYGGSIKLFSNTYFEIEQTTKYLNHIDDARRALSELHAINPNDEESILAWLLNHEEFGLESEVIKYLTCFEFPEKIKNGYIPLIKNKEVFLRVADYTDFLEFANIFNNKYWHYVKIFAAEEKLKNPDIEEKRDYYGPSYLTLKEYLEIRKS